MWHCNHCESLRRYYYYTLYIINDGKAIRHKFKCQKCGNQNESTIVQQLPITKDNLIQGDIHDTRFRKSRTNGATIY